MSTITFQSSPVQLNGTFITIGQTAPQISLVRGDLSTCTLDDYRGHNIILNIFPSLDTGICATSVRKFNTLAASHPNTVVLCISRDLPFAQNRFCTVEGIDNVVALSDFRRNSTFGIDYGVEMLDGPLAGLLARGVVVINPVGQVCHAQLVPEIKTEPDYETAMNAIK